MKMDLKDLPTHIRQKRSCRRVWDLILRCRRAGRDTLPTCPGVFPHTPVHDGQAAIRARYITRLGFTARLQWQAHAQTSGGRAGSSRNASHQRVERGLVSRRSKPGRTSNLTSTYLLRILLRAGYSGSIPGPRQAPYPAASPIESGVGSAIESSDPSPSTGSGSTFERRPGARCSPLLCCLRRAANVPLGLEPGTEGEPLTVSGAVGQEH